MRLRISLFLLAVAAAGFAPTGFAQDAVLSEPGPTFKFEDSQLRTPLMFIAYGDQRFTDPSNQKSANPKVRQWLVNQIATERPSALILNGDSPLAGDNECKTRIDHCGSRQRKRASQAYFDTVLGRAEDGIARNLRTMPAVVGTAMNGHGARSSDCPLPITSR
jgi:hypothetical protein